MGAGHLVEDKAQLAKAEGPLKRLRAAAAACPLVSRNSDFVQDLKTKMIMGMMIVMTTTGGACTCLGSSFIFTRYFLCLT